MVLPQRANPTPPSPTHQANGFGFLDTWFFQISYVTLRFFPQVRITWFISSSCQNPLPLPGTVCPPERRRTVRPPPAPSFCPSSSSPPPSHPTPLSLSRSLLTPSLHFFCNILFCFPPSSAVTSPPVALHLYLLILSPSVFLVSLSFTS